MQNWGQAMICRGEIWEVDLNPTQGAEIRKQRPCVVISSDQVGVLPLKVVVPVTEWDAGFAQAVWHVKLSPRPENGLTKESSADAFQVRSVATSRFASKLGVVSADELDDIVAAVALVIEL